MATHNNSLIESLNVSKFNSSGWNMSWDQQGLSIILMMNPDCGWVIWPFCKICANQHLVSSLPIFFYFQFNSVELHCSVLPSALEVSIVHSGAPPPPVDLHTRINACSAEVLEPVHHSILNEKASECHRNTTNSLCNEDCIEAYLNIL